MNEKIGQIIASVDDITDKAQMLPKVTDKAMGWLQTPTVSGIAQIINKLTGRLSGVIMAVYAIIFTIYCLKNAVVSMFFEDAPVGLSFGYAIAALLSIVINFYLLYKMDGVFDKIIITSTCRISSLNIFTIFSFLSVIFALASFIGGIYLTFEMEDASFIGAAIAGLLFFLLLAIYTANPTDFSILEDKEASAGEDFMAICTFLLKVSLRLTPIIVFVLALVGICQCIPEMFTAYTDSLGDHLYIHIDVMLATMSALGMFLLIGLIPVLVYFDYLIKYVILDIIRAVLSLPRKLDELKK